VVQLPAIERRSNRTRSGRLGRVMLALLCVWVAGMSGVGLYFENALGWFLFFSPGWAEGWPYGIRANIVLSVGLTGFVLLELGTAAAGVAAVVGFICTLLRIEWQYAGQGRRVWYWFAGVLFCISIVTFMITSYFVCVKTTGIGE
jgi:hypothetical protein